MKAFTGTISKAVVAGASLILAGGLGAGGAALAHGGPEPATGTQESIQAPTPAQDAQSGLNPLTLLVVGGGAAAAAGATLLLMRTKQ